MPAFRTDEIWGVSEGQGCFREDWASVFSNHCVALTSSFKSFPSWKKKEAVKKNQDVYARVMNPGGKALDWLKEAAGQKFSFQKYVFQGVSKSRLKS